MRRWALVSTVCLAVLAAGCQDRPKRVAASYSSVTKPTFHPVPKATAAPAPEGADAIPTEEDYEVRAASTIDEANLQAQLTALEHEMPF